MLNFVCKLQALLVFTALNILEPIIDEIDGVLAEHYGFMDEELDFILNYK